MTDVASSWLLQNGGQILRTIVREISAPSIFKYAFFFFSFLTSCFRLACLQKLDICWKVNFGVILASHQLKPIFFLSQHYCPDFFFFVCST